MECRKNDIVSYDDDAFQIPSNGIYTFGILLLEIFHTYVRSKTIGEFLTFDLFAFLFSISYGISTK